MRDIAYRDVVLDGVFLPLQLLGHYCPAPCKTPDGNTSVFYSNISFTDIRGSGRHDVQANFDCSPLAPCSDISLDRVRLNGTCECANADVSFTDSTPAGCSTS